MLKNKTLKFIKDKYDVEDGSVIRLPIRRKEGLTSLWAELGYEVGAEIGVDRGLYAKWICTKNKKTKLFLVDPYKAYSGFIEREHSLGQSQLDDSYEHAKQRLANYNVVFVKKTSMEAVKDFKDESLDFVFIDANHTFEFVVNDIAEWSKKIRKGGIVSGHDYWLSSEKERLYAKNLNDEQKLKLVQVKDAVDAWVKTNKISPLFLTICNSWFYVKT